MKKIQTQYVKEILHREQILSQNLICSQDGTNMAMWQTMRSKFPITVRIFH